MKRFATMVLLTAILLIFAPSAYSLDTEAGQIVKATIGQVQEVLKAKKGNVSDEALEAELQEIIFPVFDFDEMARRCLGRHWKDATKEEKDEFVALFSDLLADTYLSKIKQADESEINYDGDMLKGKRAVVKTSISDGTNSYPIHYRLREKKDGWHVYDVIIENISLVSNYRGEFNGIIRKEKMAGLLTRLREKKAAHEEKEES